MNMVKMRLKKTARYPGEVYYEATGRALLNGIRVRCVGWGSTPRKARLNLLYQMDRRRTEA